jgi:hypothetical protein
MRWELIAPGVHLLSLAFLVGVRLTGVRINSDLTPEGQTKLDRFERDLAMVFIGMTVIRILHFIFG